jgi:hypothetical protein
VTTVGAVLGVLTPANIVAGGSGYNVGDVLTVTGGAFSAAATIQVTSIGALGIITGATVASEGSYTAVPGNPVSATGGAGMNANFNLSFTAVTGVTITQVGAYTSTPPNPVSVIDGTTPAASGATFVLTYKGLTALNGKDYLGAAGTSWTLSMTDNSGGTGVAGTLNGWTLNPLTVSQDNFQVVAGRRSSRSPRSIR